MNSKQRRKHERAHEAHEVAAKAKAEQARLAQEIKDRDSRIRLLEEVNVTLTSDRDTARAELRQARAAAERTVVDAAKLRAQLDDAAKERTRLRAELERANAEVARLQALVEAQVSIAAEADEFRARAERAERRLREKATRPERAHDNRRALGLAPRGAL